MIAPAGFCGGDLLATVSAPTDDGYDGALLQSMSAWRRLFFACDLLPTVIPRGFFGRDLLPIMSALAYFWR